MMVVFKMCDSVRSARYSSVCKYCVNGESGSSLLIESTDSMLDSMIYPYVIICI